MKEALVRELIPLREIRLENLTNILHVVSPKIFLTI